MAKALKGPVVRRSVVQNVRSEQKGTAKQEKQAMKAINVIRKGVQNNVRLRQ